MAKKRKTTTSPPRHSPAAHATPPSGSPRGPARTRLWGSIAITAVAVVVALFALSRRSAVPGGGDTVLAPLPPPRVVFIADSTSPADFVGSTACASCHRAAFDAWSRSTHAAAGGDPGQVQLLAPFDGTPIRFRDAVVIPEVRGGRWRFVVRQDAKPERAISVDGVVGGGHMQGGGTQGFITRVVDGTVRFLPWERHREPSPGWFCNTEGRAGRGWVAITAAMQLSDCGDWPPSRVLGDELRFTNCQSCHGSQVTVTADTTAHRYRTTYTSLAINCESCHGPGRRHIALVGDAAAVARGEIGMRPLATLTKDQSLGTCFQCHALKDRLRGGYRSGMTLEAFYSLRYPQLGDAAHLPDGRVRTFAYQEGHRASDCYVNGGMTCTSCHDPHSQGYRDVQGRPLPGRLDDRQCTSCHASKAEQPQRHTHHAPNSPGSRCVSCHMPYLQEPEVGTAIRYTRSDHAIPVPRPLADSALGIRSACRSCHTDRAESSLDRQLHDWYGEVKPVAPAIASVLAGERASDPARAAELLLLPTDRHTAAVFAGLASFVDAQLARDVLPGKAALDRLRRLAQHEDLDVRALALAALHFSAGRDAATRALLVQQLTTAGEAEPLLRSRWATALGYLADKARARSDADGATATYRLAMEVDPSSPRLPLNLGLALADAGRPAEAIVAYRASLALDRVQPLAWINLGIALAGSGDGAGAEAAYRQALRINAHEPLAQFNLANLRLQAGALDEAAAAYRATIAADPSIALAHFYLARILAQRGDFGAAAVEVEAGLEFDPSNADALALRKQLTELRSR
ncbi:MAG: tetratricopeptide repeat protein, partial [Gemmatimonadota bacterium]